MSNLIIKVSNIKRRQEKSNNYKPIASTFYHNNLWIALCAVCPRLSDCPAKEGKNFYYLQFSKKQLRIAKRRAFEQTQEFKDHYR